MRLLDYVNDAQVSLRRAKLRTVLTVSALIIGTFTLALTTAFSQGLRSYIDTQLRAYGQTNIVQVRVGASAVKTTDSGVPYYQESRQASVSTGREGSTSYTLNQKDLDSVKATSLITSAYPDYGNLKVDYIQLGNSPKLVIGVQSAVPGESNPLAAGQFPADGQPGIVVPYAYVSALGQASATDLVGKTVTLHLSNANGQSKDYTATVTGVLPDTLHQPGAFLSYQTLGDMVHFQTGSNENYTNIIAVAGTDTTKAQRDQIKNDLQAKGFSASTYDDTLQQFSRALNIVQFGLAGFAGIALLAAMIGIVNTLLMAVFERVQEIGLLKAMGMRRRGIFFQFLIEAASIGFWGGLVGVLLAEILGRILNPILIRTIFTGFPGKEILTFPLPYMIGIVALGTIIGLLAGAFPAWRASRLDPIEALRRE